MKRLMIRDIALLLVLITISALGVSAQKGRASVSAKEVNGTYKLNFRGKFRDMSNKIKILALGGGKIRFQMDLLFPYTLRNGEIMVNMGGLVDEADIAADTAVYTSPDEKCRITLVFVKPGVLKVEQDGADADCGFGRNVNSSGVYKISSTPPKFEADASHR